MELNEGPQIGEVVPGHPTYHANVIKSYGNEPDCVEGGLPYLPGVPYLHVNRPLTVMF